MTITALELIQRAMTKAGFSRPSQQNVETVNAAGNKAYYAILEAIQMLTQLTPDWGWNEAEASTTTTSGDNTPTIASTVNPNCIFWVAIDTDYKLLQRVTREHLVREVFPGVSDPTTTDKPVYWYVLNNVLTLWRTPGATYTLYYGYQKLPQTFDAEDAGDTNLNISDEVINILTGMTAIRIMQQFGMDAKAQLMHRMIEDMDNPYSLLRMAIRNNKLEEKKERASFRFARHFRRSRLI